MKTGKRLKFIDVVADTKEYEEGFPPPDLCGCATWFADRLAEVPKEFRDTARVEFGVVDGYESSRSTSVTVTYCRLETDDEMAYRVLMESKLSKYEEAKERETLAKLKAKYES
jgi:hypothetical protein